MEKTTMIAYGRGKRKGGEYKTSVAPTITSNAFEQNNFVKCEQVAQKDNYVLEPQYRIRKLTPLECLRLMGFDDEDYKKLKAIGMSDSQIYKQAGNSIVVNVLEKIVGGMI